jgi:hypothetical protein
MVWAEDSVTESSEEPLIECDWTIDVQDEHRLGDSRNYASVFLTLNATKLGGTSSEGRYYGVAMISIEFHLAIKDEWDGVDIIGGGRFSAPAVDSNVAFELVAGDDLEAYTSPRNDGSVPVVPLLTANYSASGMFNFTTHGDWTYWCNQLIVTRPTMPKMLPLGFGIRVRGASVEFRGFNIPVCLGGEPGLYNGNLQRDRSRNTYRVEIATAVMRPAAPALSERGSQSSYMPATRPGSSDTHADIT